MSRKCSSTLRSVLLADTLRSVLLADTLRSVLLADTEINMSSVLAPPGPTSIVVCNSILAACVSADLDPRGFGSLIQKR